MRNIRESIIWKRYMNNILSRQIIIFLNHFFKPAEWFNVLNKADDETFSYALKSGEVVLDQFYGFNDFKDKTILDYGCGFGGKTAYYASLDCAKVYGADFYEDYGLAENYCKKHAFNVEFLTLKNDYRIPLADESVDIVISSAVFEHVTDVAAALKEIKRILKPNGFFLNRWHPYATRHGSHVNGLIGIPFVHLFFSEANIMRVYEKLLRERTESIGNTLLYKLDDRGFEKWESIGLNFNFWGISKMTETIQNKKFEIVQKRYFFGKAERKFVRFIPNFLKTFFIDYEILICKKNG